MQKRDYGNLELRQKNIFATKKRREKRVLELFNRIGRMIVGAPEPLDASATADYIAVTDNKDAVTFQGGQTTVGAFTDPNTVSPKAAIALIEAAVSNRPDADALREALAIRFIKQRGINMYGTTIHDTISGEKGQPETNPTTLFVSPYSRPTAGSIVMTSYQDEKGNAHVLMVKNWKDPLDHSKGVEDDWRFPGGYLNVRDPKNPTDLNHDHNLDSAAMRELQEETGLDLKKDQFKQLFVRSDCGLKEKAPTHAIDAFYLADLGRFPVAPPVRAGDDVATVRWVNLRDVSRHSGSPSFADNAKDHAGTTPPHIAVHIDGGYDYFRPAHAELLEKGTALLTKNQPSITNSNDSPSELVESAGDGNTHIHIHLDGPKTGSWQQRVQASQAAAANQQVTLH